MLNEWSDRLPPRKASELWQRSVDDEVRRRTAIVERELRESVARDRVMPAGFYDAMRHFLSLRDTMFPEMPADPAWKILVTLAQTPEGSPKASITGIAHGADVPMTTVLRYIAVMETHGVVERVAHPNDGRQVMIRLTADGRRRLEIIAEKWAIRALWVTAVPVTLLWCAFRVLGAG